MFVVLEARTKQRGGIAWWIRRPFADKAAKTEPREAFGARYSVIVAETPRKERDWNRIAALAGIFCDRLLLPGALTPPQTILRPAFPIFERMVFLNTATELMSLTSMPLYRRTIGLVDKDGKFADFLYPLLRYYTTVKVLTDETALYEREAEKVTDALGAEVILCGDESDFSGCVLLLAPDGPQGGEDFPCPVLTFQPPNTPQAYDIISGLKVTRPGTDSGIIPKGIEPHQFFAALYEYCGVESVCMPADRVTFQGREQDISEAAARLLEGAWKLYK